MIITLQLLEEEIVDINVRLNQTVRQQFSRTPSNVTFEFPNAWVALRLDHRSLD